MKKLILFIGIVLMIFSCSKPLNKKVVVTGEFENFTGIDSILLRSNSPLMDLKLTSAIGENGIFKFNLEVDNPGYYFLFCGRSRCKLYLTPGDSISIKADLTRMDSTIAFSGIGADNNIFINMMDKVRPKIDYKTVFVLDEGKFTKYNDSVYQAMDKFIADASSKNENLTKDFIEGQKSGILYDWALNNSNYISYYKYFTNDESFKTSDKFNDYLKKVNLNDTNLLSTPSYFQFLSTYYQNRANEETEKDTVKYNSEEATYNLQLDLYTKEITEPKIQELLIYNTLIDLVTYDGTKYLKDRIEKFIAETNNKTYASKLSDQIEKWKSCAPGLTFKDYSFEDINGKMVSFSSFKGKLIYIDVWATWCGPCKREIPSLKKLEEKYKKDKIAFVSVSVDEDKDAWTKMVKDDKLQGVQLWAVSWKNELCKDFNINGIPRFILIGNDGLILDPNAERPSGKIDAEIAEKLKQI